MQIVCAAAKSREIFLRQIDAAHFEIGSHVANDIRQLKREAQPFREIGIARVGKTEDVQAREPHGSRHAVAILRKLVERRIRCDRQIHLRAENQIVEIARRYVESRNRIGEGGQDRVAARLAGDRFIEHAAPTGEATPLRFEVAGLVRNIVDQPHERIEREQRVALVARQAEKCEIEAAMGSSRNPIAFSVGIADRDGVGFCRSCILDESC